MAADTSTIEDGADLALHCHCTPLTGAVSGPRSDRNGQVSGQVAAFAQRELGREVLPTQTLDSLSGGSADIAAKERREARIHFGAQTLDVSEQPSGTSVMAGVDRDAREHRTCGGRRGEHVGVGVDPVRQPARFTCQVQGERLVGGRTGFVVATG